MFFPLDNHFPIFIYSKIQLFLFIYSFFNHNTTCIHFVLIRIDINAEKNVLLDFLFIFCFRKKHTFFICYFIFFTYFCNIIQNLVKNAICYNIIYNFCNIIPQKWPKIKINKAMCCHCCYNIFFYTNKNMGPQKKVFCHGPLIHVHYTCTYK